MRHALVVGGRREHGRRRQDVAGDAPGGAIAGIHQTLAVDGERERAAHRRIGQERMRVGAVHVERPPVRAESGVVVGLVEDQSLDQGAEARNDDALAGGLQFCPAGWTDLPYPSLETMNHASPALGIPLMGPDPSQHGGGCIAIRFL